MTYLVRTSCEYSVSVETDSEEEALALAGKIDVSNWDTAEWSPREVESTAEVPELQGHDDRT